MCVGDVWGCVVCVGDVWWCGCVVMWTCGWCVGVL